MWSPIAPEVDSPRGWTGSTPPTAPDPVAGWRPIAARIAADAGVGGDAAGLVAQLLATDVSKGVDTAAIVSALTGAGSGSALDVAAFHALVYGVDTGTGLDAASWVEHWSVAGTDSGVGGDLAGLLARLKGMDAAVGVDDGPLSARLPGVDESIGVDEAHREYSFHVSEQTVFDQIGSFTYLIPAWCTHLDIVAVGGAASGQTGSGAIGTAGKGGNAGQWAGVTIRRGDTFPSHISSMTIAVGAGGAQAANSDLAAPNPGERSVYSADLGSGSVWSGWALGGSGTTSGQNGAGAGTFTWNGATYAGGAGGTGNGGGGNPPGGGGAGGNGGIFGSRTRGGYGGRGGVWITAYQQR